jgi:hypothetical protein
MEEKKNERKNFCVHSCYFDFGCVYVHASIIGRTAATRNDRNKSGSLNDPKRKTPTSKRLPKFIPKLAFLGYTGHHGTTPTPILCGCAHHETASRAHLSATTPIQGAATDSGHHHARILRLYR